MDSDFNIWEFTIHFEWTKMDYLCCRFGNIWDILSGRELRILF